MVGLTGSLFIDILVWNNHLTVESSIRKPVRISETITITRDGDVSAEVSVLSPFSAESFSEEAESRRDFTNVCVSEKA